MKEVYIVKIVLDPGHAGLYNPGKVEGYYESVFNWKLAQLLKDELESGYSVQVELTKKSLEDDPYLVTRGQSSAGADLFLSLHTNAAVNNDTAAFPLVIYSLKQQEQADKAKALMTGLQAFISKNVKKTTGGYIMTREYPGQKGVDYYGVLRGASGVGTPCFIVEHSFHTNADWCNFALVDANVKTLANYEANLIAQVFNIPKRAADKKALYIVQAGAFSVKENAEALVRKLKLAGFPACIVLKED